MKKRKTVTARCEFCKSRYNPNNDRRRRRHQSGECKQHAK